MQNELDIPDPCPGAVYVLKSSHLLFNTLSFSVTFFLSIVFILSGLGLAFKISQIAQNLAEFVPIILGFEQLKYVLSESGVYSFLLLFSLI